MLLRIFLIASALGSLVLLVLIYAVVSGQTPGTPTTSPSASASGSAAASAPASTVPSASASASASAAASGPTATVTIANLSFGANLTVKAGTTVVFDNKDVVPHTATNGTNGVPAAGALFDLALNPGASASYTFDKAGTYQVTCKLHPLLMNMTITVN
jgi:plastocyanin